MQYARTRFWSLPNDSKPCRNTADSKRSLGHDPTKLNIKGRLKNNFQTTFLYRKQPALQKSKVQAAFNADGLQCECGEAIHGNARNNHIRNRIRHGRAQEGTFLTLLFAGGGGDSDTLRRNDFATGRTGRVGGGEP